MATDEQLAGEGNGTFDIPWCHQELKKVKAERDAAIAERDKWKDACDALQGDYGPSAALRMHRGLALLALGMRAVPLGGGVTAWAEPDER